MNLGSFGFLADENVQPAVVSFLRERGHDVRTAGEAGLLGAVDAELMRFAVAENRVIVSHDADFGRLAIAAGEPFIGLIFLRPGHIDPSFTIRALDRLMTSNLEVIPPFIITVRRQGNGVRIRLRLGP